MNLTFEIDTEKLLSKENVNGVKAALGVMDKEDPIALFSNYITHLIDEPLCRFENVKLVNASIFDEEDIKKMNKEDKIQDGGDPALEEDLEDTEYPDDEFKYSEFVDGLFFRISDGLFNIKAKQGNIVRLILNSKLKKDYPELEWIDIAKEVGALPETIEWVEINKDFLIEYLDSENNKQLYIYGGQN